MAHNPDMDPDSLARAEEEVRVDLWDALVPHWRECSQEPEERAEIPFFDVEPERG